MTRQSARRRNMFRLGGEFGPSVLNINIRAYGCAAIIQVLAVKPDRHGSRRYAFVLPPILASSPRPAISSVLVAFDQQCEDAQNENDDRCNGRDEDVSLVLLFLKPRVWTRPIRTVYHPAIGLIERVEIDPDTGRYVFAVFVAVGRVCQDLLIEMCVFKSSPWQAEHCPFRTSVGSITKRHVGGGQAPGIRLTCNATCSSS